MTIFQGKPLKTENKDNQVMVNTVKHDAYMYYLIVTSTILINEFTSSVLFSNFPKSVLENILVF
jgi:disulfide oxidoreductase YuzD